MPAAFADRWIRGSRRLGLPLCVGIDPHLALIPAVFRSGAMQPGARETAAAVELWCLALLERVAGRVAAVKPQSACFEALGPAGAAVLARVLAKARACGLASSTLDRLLRLARPEPPVKSTVDLAALARDVARLFEPRLRGRNVSLAVEAQSDPPALRLDRGQMTQLLLNLLTNSAQAVGDGGAISVRLAPFPDGDGVILSVSDDGAGIPAEQLEKIWEPFFTTKDEGTCLGLPICRQIAELHGGTITVESAPGEGTTVLVLLPTEPSEIISAHGADPDR